jgi:hypothetical protein
MGGWRKRHLKENLAPNLIGGLFILLRAAVFLLPRYVHVLQNVVYLEALGDSSCTERKKILLSTTIGMKFFNSYSYTVKPVYNHHPWNPKTVALGDRWSLFRGYLLCKSSK